MKKPCFIFGAGEYYGSEFSVPLPDGSFSVAADGGFARMLKHGVKPDLVVGDFDSLGYVPDFPDIIKYPAEKDDTDMAIAVRECEKRGFDIFVIYGGLGGRLDHTLANIQTLFGMCADGKSGYLIGKNTVITAIKNGGIEFPTGLSGMISVFAAGVASGVTIDGLKYEISDAVLTNTNPLGVSNEFLGAAARVSVLDGTLLVLWNESAESFLERL